MVCNILLRVGALLCFAVGLFTQAVLMTDLVDGGAYVLFETALCAVDGVLAPFLTGYTVPIVAALT